MGKEFLGPGLKKFAIVVGTCVVVPVGGGWGWVVVLWAVGRGWGKERGRVGEGGCVGKRGDGVVDG